MDICFKTDDTEGKEDSWELTGTAGKTGQWHGEE